MPAMNVNKKSPRVNKASTSGLAQARKRARLQKEIRDWKKTLRSLREAARASEQLSERDFAIRINARG